MTARSAVVSALHARLALPPSLTTSILQRCLLDRTSPAPENNTTLARHGRTVLEYYITDWLVTKHPRLPIPVLKNVVDSYIGKKSLSDIGRGWGVEAGPSEGVSIIMNSTAKGEKKTNETTYKDDAYADFVRSVVGAVEVHADTPRLQKFINQHFLSRDLDILRSFTFTDPGRQLSNLCMREGLPQPSTRLIAETGRKTNSAVFIQAVYVGEEKLSEGAGTSLKEAKFTAESNALKSWLMFEDKTSSLPYTTLIDSTKAYKPVMVDTGDIIV